MATKPAKLSSSLVAKKGEASPTIEAPQTSTSIPSVNVQPVFAKENISVKKTALTVKLDKDRFTRLKLAGANASMSSQEIFVAALDAWLDQNNHFLTIPNH